MHGMQLGSIFIPGESLQKIKVANIIGDLLTSATSPALQVSRRLCFTLSDYYYLDFIPVLQGLLSASLSSLKKHVSNSFGSLSLVNFYLLILFVQHL